MPDLGYYLGYKICGRYYNKETNKMQAISDILQIDYNDKNSVMTFYQNSGFKTSRF
jgi:NADH:ubiquinone oxidoreductase subunit E